MKYFNVNKNILNLASFNKNFKNNLNSLIKQS